MSRDIITLVESSEKVHEKVKNFSSYIKELGISNMSSAMYFLVISECNLYPVLTYVKLLLKVYPLADGQAVQDFCRPKTSK